MVHVGFFFRIRCAMEHMFSANAWDLLTHSFYMHQTQTKEVIAY